jgi:hypothetical protein
MFSNFLILGTHNVLKQIMESMYGRHMRGHTCKKPITYSPHMTSKTDDSCLYIYEKEKRKYRFYKAETPVMNGVIMAVSIMTELVEDFGCLELDVDFSKVGFFRNAGPHNKVKRIPVSEITGKALMTGRFICTIPSDVSQESY